jgi:hypothetical protein
MCDKIDSFSIVWHGFWIIDCDRTHYDYFSRQNVQYGRTYTFLNNSYFFKNT